MLSLISTLGGLLISGLPKLLEFFQAKADQKQAVDLQQEVGEHQTQRLAASDPPEN